MADGRMSERLWAELLALDLPTTPLHCELVTVACTEVPGEPEAATGARIAAARAAARCQRYLDEGNLPGAQAAAVELAGWITVAMAGWGATYGKIP